MFEIYCSEQKENSKLHENESSNQGIKNKREEILEPKNLVIVKANSTLVQIIVKTK